MTTVEDPAGLESALARTEAAALQAARAVDGLARELKRARAAAADGQVAALRGALRTAADLAEQVLSQVAGLGGEYDVDEADLLASGAYAKELLAAAAEAGVRMIAEDDRLLCYPSVVRVLPGELALEIDRKRARGIRPSVVVAALAKAQQSGPRFKVAPFLASLVAGYDLTVAAQGKAAGTVVRLLDVYEVLTLLPGQSREYAKAEFARDLYQLDRSGVTESARGRRLRWAASSGTRQTGVLTTVATTGSQQRYWGIAVDPGSA